MVGCIETRGGQHFAASTLERGMTLLNSNSAMEKESMETKGTEKKKSKSVAGTTGELQCSRR
jgi:hypothetical protein